MTVIKAIGVMSGTSLDGVDIAYCEFREHKNNWEFKIGAAETIEYSQEWKKRLENVKKLDALSFIKTDNDYGKHLGKCLKSFIEKHKIKPDLIASHGHTVFHQPKNNLTCQIGSGAEIAAVTGQKVVCDFRSLDVTLGGQGAPLTPLGDKLLFPDYDFCLNLGGFSNISFDSENKRVAFDICPCNIVMNLLAQKTDKNFDENGQLASKGQIINGLLQELNQLNYYKNPYPKSLGKEWLLEKFIPVLEKFPANENDLLRTIVEHISEQIRIVIKNYPVGKILVTGGGAFNTFLTDQIEKKIRHEVIIPEEIIVKFKEALIFAFLGILRLMKKPNCLSSVTGAFKDNIGGAVYIG